MARAAKNAALRLIAAGESEGENEEDDSVVDDVHDDVPAVEMADNDSDQSSEDESDNDGDDSDQSSEDENDNDGDAHEEQHGNVHGRDGTEWQIIDETFNVAGRAAQSDILRPAPGLTAYAYQRIRDHPIEDCFLLFLSPG